MGYHIYKFLDDESNILYIGKTTRLRHRLHNEHFGSIGHLPDGCYESVRSICYAEFTEKSDMDIMEIYLIKKHNPKFNAAHTQDTAMTISLKEPNWIPIDKDIVLKMSRKKFLKKISDKGNFYPVANKDREGLLKIIKSLRNENRILKNEINSYYHMKDFYEKQAKFHEQQGKFYDEMIQKARKITDNSLEFLRQQCLAAGIDPDKEFGKFDDVFAENIFDSEEFKAAFENNLSKIKRRHS